MRREAGEMSDQERERELARARAARWRAKHPGASVKAVAASRQRRKMKRDMADLAGVAAGIVKRGDIPERNFRRAKAALYGMLLEMDAKADRKKRDRSITAALTTARRVARQLWGAEVPRKRGYLWWKTDHCRAMREIERIERDFRKKGDGAPQNIFGRTDKTFGPRRLTKRPKNEIK
jgi:hypothetical protein